MPLPSPRRFPCAKRRWFRPALERLENRVVPSVLIPIPSRQALVFDPTRNQLDVTAGGGLLQRYDVARQTLLAPIQVGATLDNADIAPDGNTLLVADSTNGLFEGAVHEVNLNTGAVQDAPYPLGFYEGGSQSVAIRGDGKAFVTTGFNGSGFTSLRLLDPSTNTYTVRSDAGEMWAPTQIYRSADRTAFLFMEGGISSGPMILYNTAADNFNDTFGANVFLGNFRGAVNRNGTLVALLGNTGTNIYDSHFTVLKNLATATGGGAFDPVHDVFYTVNSSTGQLLAYDSNSWNLLYQVPVGETIPGPSPMTISPDGSLLFVGTPSGVRMFNLPSPSGNSFGVSGFPTTVTAGMSGSFTVTALAAGGATNTTYTGTVHLVSSDGQAALPADYTFVAAEHGVHTFTATLKTAGSQSLTVTDTSDRTIAGNEGSIAVNAAAATQFGVNGPAMIGSNPFTLTVTALDPYGNRDPNYTGLIHFSGTDTQATLPPDDGFSYLVQGQRTFPVTLSTPGPSTVTVTDKTFPSITGTSTPIQVIPSVLIPAANHRGLVYDNTRQQLDIISNSGSLLRWSVTSQSLLTPFSVGVTPVAADVTPDDSSLFVTDTTLPNPTQGVVHQVNLSTGAVTDAFYSLAFYEIGSFDVALGSNGKGLATTQFNGSGWTPLHQLATATGAISNDPVGQVRQNSQVTRGADRSLMVLTQSNISSGPVGLYDATSNTLLGSKDTNTFVDNAGSAVNRNGTLAAVQVGGGTTIFDRTFTQVRFLPGLDGGLAFDPVHDILYGVNSSTGLIVAYDTNTWTVRYQLPVGETVSTYQALANGTMAVSGDSKYLFLATNSGVRMYSLPNSSLDALTLSGPATPLTAGAAGTFTITADSAPNTVDTNYTGTLHFTSSDPHALLPSDYTFTTADRGTHTFAVTFKTTGSQSLTATDTARASITTTVAGLTVNPAAAAQLTMQAGTATMAGNPLSVSLTAYDGYGNVATGYTGTIHLTSSDGQAALPADYTFGAGDHGTRTFAVTLKSAGSQSVTATDTNNTALGATQGNITVSPAAAGQLVVNSASTVTAGTALSVSVMAVDAYGNTALAYTGKVHFTSSDGHASLPADYTFLASDHGVHNFTVTFKTAGIESVTATDTANGSLAATRGNLAVSPGAVSQLLVHAPTTTVAGMALSVSVTAVDAYGNTATGYTGTVHTTSSDGLAVLPADYTFTAADLGSRSLSVTLATAATQSVTIADTSNGALTTTLRGIVVSPAPAARLGVSAAASATAGTAVTVTVTALDAYGNTAKGYRGTVGLTSSDNQAVLPAGYLFVAGDQGTHQFTVALETAGPQSITATDQNQGNITGTRGSVVVAAAATSQFLVAGLPTTIAPGATRTITVTAQDRFGNPTPGYTGQVHFTSSDTQASLPPDYTFLGSDAGQHSFGVLLKTAGSRSVTVADAATGLLTGTAATTVNPAAAAALVLSNLAATTAGAAQTFTVTAQDAFGNTVTDYTGSVSFTSSDRQAVLPGSYLFVAADQGVHPFSATLRTAGNQSLSVRDDSNVTATQSGIVVTPASAAVLQLSGFPATTTAGVAGSFTVTAVDAFGNQAAGYTGTVHFTSGDGQASLPADYAFKAGDNGQRTFSAALKTAGTQSLTVKDAVGNLLASQTGIVVNTATASQLVFLQQPIGTTAGAVLQPAVTVAVEDPFGNRVGTSSASVTATLNNAAGATLSGTVPVNAVSGVATFADLSVDRVGTNYTLTASSAGLTGATSAPFAIAPGNAAILLLTPSTTTPTAGAAFTLAAALQDTHQNVATGYRGTLTFTLPAGATLADATTGQPLTGNAYTFTSGDGGMHSFTATLSHAGAQSVRAADAANSSLTTTSGVTVAAAAASQLIVTIAPPGAVGSGSPFGLTVAAEDPFGNVDPTFTSNVTLALNSNPGNGTLSGTLTVPANQGVASFAGLTLSPAASGYTLKATAPGLSAVVTPSINVTGLATLALSSTSVLDFRPASTVVGTLSSTEVGTGSGHTFTYTLVAGTGSADNAEFFVNGNQLLTADAFDVAIRSSYSIRLRTSDESGRALDQMFTIAIAADPAVSRSGRTLTVLGLQGNDRFSFVPGALRHLMSLDGVNLAVDAASVDNVVFQGGSGSASASLSGGSGTNTATLSPNSGALSGTGYSVTANQVATLIVHGGPNDTATLHDAPTGANVFSARPGDTTLSGSGYSEEAVGFYTATAFAGAGDNAVAYLYDSPGSDFFTGTSTYGYLSGPSFFNEAVGFALVEAVSQLGGQDTAVLYDAPGVNTFVGTTLQAYAYGQGYFDEAYGFASTVASRVLGSTDVAQLFDAGGSNTFVGTPTYGYLLGSGFFNEAAGYQSVVGIAGLGSSDTAELFDAGGKNTLTATSGWTNLQGTGFLNEVVGFRAVAAYAGPGSSDTALFYGTGGADNFLGTGSSPNFVGQPSYSVLSGTGVSGAFDNAAIGFQVVSVSEGSSSTATAALYDAPGTNAFAGSGNTATLTGSLNYTISLAGFGSVAASANYGGVDSLNVLAVDYVFTHLGIWH